MRPPEYDKRVQTAAQKRLQTHGGVFGVIQSLSLNCRVNYVA
jgi:hypothetical protein